MVKIRKLPMQFRESKEKRNVTFTKRRKGLFSKAAELCMLCDAQVAILVTSPCSKQKIFSFGPTSTDAILESFIGRRVPEKMDDRTKLLALSLSTEIKALDTELCHLNRNKKRVAEVSSVGETCPWMDIVEFEKSVESIEEIRALIDALEKLKAKAEKRLENYSCHNSSDNMGITTTITFATSKDTHNNILNYDHGSQYQAHIVGSSSVYEQKNNIVSSDYNGSNFPLGGDMNGIGNNVLVTTGLNDINTSLHNAPLLGDYNENNMVTCYNVDTISLAPNLDCLSHQDIFSRSSFDSNDQFLDSSFMNEFLEQPLF